MNYPPHCFKIIILLLLFQDSKEDWPVDGSAENRSSPGLPSGAAWYGQEFKIFSLRTH